MPPARKTVYPYQVAETAAKRPFPRHIINIQDLVRPNDIGKNPEQGHIVINIRKDSPEEISIKRSGDQLTVETKSGDSHQGGQGVELIKRSYKIPEGGFTEELGAQLAVDGLVSVRTQGVPRMARVIPITLPSPDELKQGRIFKVDPITGAQTVYPMSFPLFGTKANGLTQGTQKSAAEGDEKEMTANDQPVSSADQEMGVPEDVPEDLPEDVPEDVPESTHDERPVETA